MIRKHNITGLLCLLLLGSSAGCADKLTDIEQVELSFEVNTDKLDLPADVSPTYSEARLTMEDQNRWGEVLTYSVEDIGRPIAVRKGYFRAQFAATIHYRHEGADRSYPVACYLNGNGTSPENLIQPQIRATLPLERSKK